MENWKIAIIVGVTVFVVLVGFGTIVWYVKSNKSYIS